MLFLFLFAVFKFRYGFFFGFFFDFSLLFFSFAAAFLSLPLVRAALFSLQLVYVCLITQKELKGLIECDFWLARDARGNILESKQSSQKLLLLLLFFNSLKKKIFSKCGYFVYYALLMTFPWLGMRCIHQQLFLSLSHTFLHEKFTRSDEIICAASSLLLFIINQLALESNLLTTTTATTNLG